MRAGTRRLPPLFWQAIFILLPVTVLSVVSLISLRRDEQTAEQDARNRAVEDSQSLAWAMRASVSAELQRFLELQNGWITGARLAGQPTVTGVFFDHRLDSDIREWDKDYPGLTIAELATPQGEILADGRQIDPPEMPVVPTPPKWFLELSPRQKKLWERLRRAVEASEGRASIEKANETFFSSHPSDEALSATIWLQQPPTNMIGNSDAFPTETGLSFEEIACYRLLSAKDANLTDSLVQSIWWQLMNHSSFTSDRLLEMAETLTNRTDAALSQRVYWMRQYWNAQSKVRTRLPLLRQFSILTNWNAGQSRAVWVDQSDSGGLALLEPCTVGATRIVPRATAISGPGIVQAGRVNEWIQLPVSNSPAERGYTVWFVPRQVVKAIFTRALEENKFFISGYETPVVTVAGQSFVLSARKPSLADSSHSQLLGSASQTAGAVSMPDAVPFSVNLYLTSLEQMLSAEHRRIRLFAMLIIGAIFSALAGLAASWRAFNRQQELGELKTNFVSSVSHELRAPIASVRLMAENLERGKIPESSRQNEYFRFIVQECRRLSSLIENVLDFSRIEQGRKQYEFEPANLVALVQTTVKLMEPYAVEKGVRLEIADAGVSSIELEVDSRAIQQALVNLIDNAIKHSPKGETVAVGIEMQKTHGGPDADRLLTRAALFVADHGPGIPPEEHGKIFERFYRRGSELRRETQGVGIGLSVVQHIVEAHGGHVRVESEPGKGSRFTIELPVTKLNE